MDDYYLAETFLNQEELTIQEIDLDKFQRIPFTELLSFGGMIAELVPQFRTITSESTIHLDGLFRAFNPKTGEQVSDLMYKSKQVADAFIGSITQKNKKFDQTAFKKATDICQTTTTVTAINPAALMIAAGIIAMSKKLNVIEENQQKIISFLEKDKESKLQGNLNFLRSVFTGYQFHWNDVIYKTAQLVKIQDIKQESEQNIVFYHNLLDDEMNKTKIFTSKRDVKKNMRKLIEEFSYYRLAIYLYSFASYMEIVILENFKSDYLRSLIEKISEDSFQYARLYTAAYDKLENMAAKSIESEAIKGAAIVSKGLGELIEKIPIVERGQFDENLIAASNKLDRYKETSITVLLTNFHSMKNCLTNQFISLIETIDELHNGNPIILADDENVYVQATI